jgi:hypothetical protein
MVACTDGDQIAGGTCLERQDKPSLWEVTDRQAAREIDERNIRRGPCGQIPTRERCESRRTCVADRDDDLR